MSTTYDARVRVVDSDGNPRVGIMVGAHQGMLVVATDTTDNDGWAHLEIETFMAGSIYVEFGIGKYSAMYGPYEIEPDEEFSTSITFDDN